MVIIIVIAIGILLAPTVLSFLTGSPTPVPGPTPVPSPTPHLET
jgi:FlaG/FlaF family flagellin (archaellin)